MPPTPPRAARRATAGWLTGTALALAALAGCSSVDLADTPVTEVSQAGPAADGAPRVLFVLFDGTRNDPSSRTNVFLMKQAIEAASLPATLLYLPGVGSAQDPPLLGAALGMGMEARINAGYRFLSARHRSGDRIVILGFSRGAHQARALAGLVAYAGLLQTGGLDERRQQALANAVIDAVKDDADRDVEADWRRDPTQPPRLAALQQRLGVALRPASIGFVGVWDTVPGSSFKRYGTCSEEPDARTGERYKTGSYPGIERIVHAVALDEKRSMFSPILLCPPMLADRTQVKEVWFAGAHADVGGGYEVAPHELARVSLAWMAGELSAALGAPLAVPAATDADALAAAHWSMGDSPANLRSHCADRRPPPDAVLHPTVVQRRGAGSAPLVVRGAVAETAYPFDCARMGTPP